MPKTASTWMLEPSLRKTGSSRTCGGEENNDFNNMENEIAAIRSEEVDKHHRRLDSLSTIEAHKQREQNKWKKETANHQKTKISESQEIIQSGKGQLKKYIFSLKR